MSVPLDAAADAKSRACLRRLLARQALPLALIVLCAWLLRERAAALDVGGILQAVRDIPAQGWIAALLATAISFWAVGRYDAVIHRLLDTGVGCPAARQSGIAAIATSQTTGFGLLIGTLTRWRMLPELTLWQSARVTAAVTVSFMVGLAVLGAGLTLILGSRGPVPAWIALAVLATALCLPIVSLWSPRRLLHLTLPPVKAQVTILGLVALDTLAAAVGLYGLLPVEYLPPAGVFYGVFLLALGAGLAGATPGGVGPFEFVCLAYLPTVPEPALLAAITGYRLIYYGLPGAVAAILLVAGSNPPEQTRRAVLVDLLPPAVPSPGAPLDHVLLSARRAEAQLLRHGEFGVLCDGGAPVALAAATGQSLIVLGDALPPDLAEGRVVAVAAGAAARRMLIPCLYKCPARLALAARAAGWRVLRISQEAWIAPHRHDLNRPACRQLRRQLRKAQAAELRAVEGCARLPMRQMHALAAEWALQRGGARGFSMGRFDAACIDRQRVFLCYDVQRRLVAFATFHETRHEWTLDQMCQTRRAPQGAMYLLIATAIEAALARCCPRLSLAATPLPCTRWRWMPSGLAAVLDLRSGAPGLIRFKSAFAPNWEPLYVAAPSHIGLALAGLDLIDRITRARPVRAAARLPAPASVPPLQIS